MNETISQIARGQVIHPTVSGLKRLVHRPDIVFIPIADLPAVPLGLIRCTAHENGRTRACAQIAAELEETW